MWLGRIFIGSVGELQDRLRTHCRQGRGKSTSFSKVKGPCPFKSNSSRASRLNNLFQTKVPKVRHAFTFNLLPLWPHKHPSRATSMPLVLTRNAYGDVYSKVWLMWKGQWRSVPKIACAYPPLTAKVSKGPHWNFTFEIAKAYDSASGRPLPMKFGDVQGVKRTHNQGRESLFHDPANTIRWKYVGSIISRLYWNFEACLRGTALQCTIWLRTYLMTKGGRTVDNVKSAWALRIIVWLWQYRRPAGVVENLPRLN